MDNRHIHFYHKKSALGAQYIVFCHSFFLSFFLYSGVFCMYIVITMNKFIDATAIYPALQHKVPCSKHCCVPIMRIPVHAKNCSSLSIPALKSRCCICSLSACIRSTVYFSSYYRQRVSNMGRASTRAGIRPLPWLPTLPLQYGELAIMKPEKVLHRPHEWLSNGN